MNIVDGEKSADRSVRIDLTIKNASNDVCAAGGRWAVKDNGTNQAVEAVFGRIVPGGNETQSVYLPSGAESGIFKLTSENDPTKGWLGVHGGNDTEVYNLTLGPAA